VRDHHSGVPPLLRPLSRRVGRGYRRVEHTLRNARSTPHEAPIFVLGNQKSGTSAIAALLGRACGLDVSLDMLMEVGRPRIQEVPAGSLSLDAYIRLNRWEFSHALVKEPNLTFLYPQLAAAFPRSRFVFIARDPRDNIRSLLNAIRIPGDLARLEDRQTRELAPGWALVLDGRWCGVEGEHYIDQLAARWVRCIDIYLESRDAQTLCRYEDFLADKLGELTRVALALGQPVVSDVAAEVDRQFQTRGDRSVAWEAFFGPEHLSRIERICADGMRKLGYEPLMP
jgi:hypothetical protein